MSMRALAKEIPAITGSPEVDELVESDDLETLDEALVEVHEQIGRLSHALELLWRRRGALVSGKREVRRRRARSYLDRFQLPVTFISIEVEGKTEERRPA